MYPTEPYMKALYRERLREAERVSRIAEARRLAPRAPGPEKATRNTRSPLALGWLLRMILRAGAV
jgi:hypothetical protein